jgi:hypothetical protein
MLRNHSAIILAFLVPRHELTRENAISAPLKLNKAPLPPKKA